MVRKVLQFALLASVSLLVGTGAEAGHPLVPVGDEVYQWVYDYIRSLQLRGHLLDLNPAVKPYLRMEIARSLLEVEREDTLSHTRLTSVERRMLRRLKREFATELGSLEKGGGRRWSPFYGADLRGSLEFLEGESTELWESLWLDLGAEFEDRFSLYGRLLLDRRLAHDTTYTGKVWRGLTALTDRAGVCLTYGKLRLQMGRERYVWGLSRIESLVLSSNSFPIDQGHLELVLGPIRFSSFAASLSAERIVPTEGEEIQHVSRYLSGHRLDLQINRILHLGLSETVVYGGAGRNLELYYLNPLVWYHVAQLNENRDDNTFFAVDLLVRPLRGTEAYGELLLDDYQVEDETPGDKEPNHYAYLFGFAVADPLGLEGWEIFGEYSRITNWTYNQQCSWNRYQNRSRPIGSSLGPDGDRWDIGLNLRALPRLEMKLVYTHLRSGEGRIDSDWNEPWLLSIDEGSEDFPSGVVAKTDRLGFEGQCFVDPGFQFKLNLDLLRTRNLGNQSGFNENRFGLSLTAIYSFAN
jgi:hypothetical protein